MTRLRRGLVGLGAVVLTACAPPVPTRMPTVTPLPTTTATTTALPSTATPTPADGFRVVGYATDGETIVDAIAFDKLTHINYAFLTPEADGSLNPLLNPWKLDDIVTRAHAQGVRVLISVGGWGWDPQFEALAADPEARQRFVDGLLAFERKHDLDGVDIDWEYPDTGESAGNFLALMQALRAGLPEGHLLTMAVVALGDLAAGVPSETFALVDFANVMAYDGSSTDHSPMAYAEAALDFWAARGLPMDKTVLGVPFYSRPGELPYRKLVAADPRAAWQDEVTVNGIVEYYNGIPTIQRKTELALARASGIMMWALHHDTTDATSLLTAIDAVRRR